MPKVKYKHDCNETICETSKIGSHLVVRKFPNFPIYNFLFNFPILTEEKTLKVKFFMSTN